MPAIETPPLPPQSLLAAHRGPECYRDAFCTAAPGRVSLRRYIGAFYSSMAFLPERKALALIGRGAGAAEIAALAEGTTTRFAAWSVEAREEDQILLRDFQDSTCSWLWVEPAPGNTTRLWFGSGVRRPDAPLVRALTPFHRWYSRVLLKGAVRELRG